MKILIHDYPGHPFQLRLSRRLAERGHDVLHLFSKDVETPKGDVATPQNDPTGLEVQALSIGQPLDKYRFLRRTWQEARYAVALFRRIRHWRPDVILCAASPLPMIGAVLAGKSLSIPVIAWVQDIYCLGMRHVGNRLPVWLRRPALSALCTLEAVAIRACPARILISPDFADALASINVPAKPYDAVIENWSPLDKAVVPSKDNDWSRRNALSQHFVFLVSGTLGLKHNPQHLVNLARAFRPDHDVRIVVISQGLGRNMLEEAKRAEQLDNLLLFDFQPLSLLDQVLASADVTVMLLEPFAGELSVPSKVYSYLWASRPILAAVPKANLAWRKVTQLRAGLSVDPVDEDGFVQAAIRLRRDAALRRSCVDSMAEHAEDMNRIADDFMAVFDQVTRP